MISVKDIFERWWSSHKLKVKENTVISYEGCYNKYISKLNNRVFSKLKTLEF